MAQCIIYARVSTRQQAWGHGIVRQIECCQAQAKRDCAWVRSVYVDICSGMSEMPNRELAVAEAKEAGYPIYVEAIDRWTRRADDETLCDDKIDLVVCGEIQREVISRIQELVR
jgi:DNA invertase Pin-like site-specific DNA recombinase